MGDWHAKIEVDEMNNNNVGLFCSSKTNENRSKILEVIFKSNLKLGGSFFF